MLTPAEFCEIGEILKSHGHQGEMKISFKADIADKFKRNRFLFLEIRKKPVPFFIEKYTVAADDVAIVKLEDINDPEAVNELQNYSVLVPCKEIPKNILTLLLESDLIGYNAFRENELLGEIVDIYESSKQRLLVIERNGKEILIPYHEEFVKEVDREKHTVILKVPDDLLDL
jgi:16S rRNA processing protein RimM